MFSLKIADRRVAEALMPQLDDDIAAIAEEEATAAEAAEIDALIEEAEREWTATERRETTRLSRMFTDQTRARRARRREDRTLLRMLPTQLTATNADGQVA